MNIAITAVSKPRLTQRDKWKQRPVVVRYRTYCDDLRAALPGYELPVELNLTFYMPFPKSYSKRKCIALDGLAHDEKPDIDNLVKGFMDAFKCEDKHVASLIVQKRWSNTGSIVING